jgi:hypothetical protein
MRHHIATISLTLSAALLCGAGWPAGQEPALWTPLWTYDAPRERSVERWQGLEDVLSDYDPGTDLHWTLTAALRADGPPTILERGDALSALLAQEHLDGEAAPLIPTTALPRSPEVIRWLQAATALSSGSLLWAWEIGERYPLVGLMEMSETLAQWTALERGASDLVWADHAVTVQRRTYEEIWDYLRWYGDAELLAIAQQLLAQQQPEARWRARAVAGSCDAVAAEVLAFQEDPRSLQRHLFQPLSDAQLFGLRLLFDAEETLDWLEERCRGVMADAYRSPTQRARVVRSVGLAELANLGGLAVVDVLPTNIELTPMDHRDASRAGLIVAIAVRRYQLDYGRWPDSKEALLPDYLEVLPLDPFTGEPPRYLPESGAVLAPWAPPGSHRGDLRRAWKQTVRDAHDG